MLPFSIYTRPVIYWTRFLRIFVDIFGHIYEFLYPNRLLDWHWRASVSRQVAAFEISCSGYRKEIWRSPVCKWFRTCAHVKFPFLVNFFYRVRYRSMVSSVNIPVVPADSPSVIVNRTSRFHTGNTGCWLGLASIGSGDYTDLLWWNNINNWFC